MRFKFLEISGFKSFASKTTLEFGEGVTAVVGPNGTGKSNIVDAILWVLGTRGKKIMRSQKGGDLIFHGSERRRSAGRAQVRFQLEDPHNKSGWKLSSIVIARKVFRDGENEYFLNNRPARLLDIEELTAKIKIGSNIVIRQGEADFFINASPEERLAALRDISGVKALQIKNNEAKRKLAKAETNIEETNRLLKEITPHLRFLERQKKKLDERLELEENLKKAKKRYFALFWKTLKRQKESLLKEQESLLRTINKKQKDKQKKEKELTKIEKYIFVREEEAEVSPKLQAAEEKRSKLFRQLGEVETKINKLESFSRFEKKIEPIVVNPAAIKGLVKEISGKIEKYQGRGMPKSVLGALSAKVKELFSYLGFGADNQDKEKEKRLASEELKKLNKKKEELTAAIRSLEQDIKEIGREEEAKTLNNLRTQFHESNGILREILMTIENLNRNQDEVRRRGEELREKEKEIEREVRDIPGFFDEIGELDLKNKNLDKLRLTMERLQNRVFAAGEIDENILEEYESTKKRFDFLSREKEDLNKAINSLTKIIEEVSKKIKIDLKFFFDKVNSEFQRYVNMLFGGGKASLVLDKKGDQEGVEVKINLPRKKVRRPDLLSGGEKSLVSLAFLFSVISVSRPPFLILDEVDAALDELNAHRFMRILKDLTPESQFILITHNRESMKLADVLYGISMRDGVSSVYSLKLS